MADEPQATPEAAPATPAPTPPPAPDATKAEAPSTPLAKKEPTCPACKGPLERYAGAGAHKLGTAFCHACGIRHRLKG